MSFSKQMQIWCEKQRTKWENFLWPVKLSIRHIKNIVVLFTKHQQILLVFNVGLLQMFIR